MKRGTEIQWPTACLIILKGMIFFWALLEEPLSIGSAARAHLDDETDIGVVYAASRHIAGEHDHLQGSAQQGSIHGKKPGIGFRV